jgi:hypothetical protein
MLLASTALASNASAITFDFNGPDGMPSGFTVTASSSAEDKISGSSPTLGASATEPVTLTVQSVTTSSVGAPEDWQNLSFEIAYQQGIFFCTIHRTDISFPSALGGHHRGIR